MGLKEAIIRASQGNEITKIWTDRLSSVMAVLAPHTPHQLVGDIQSLLTQNQNILVRWIKPHDGYRGNEEADTLAKKAITEGVVVKALKPRCELKQHLQELFFKIGKIFGIMETLDVLFIKCSKQFTSNQSFGHVKKLCLSQDTVHSLHSLTASIYRIVTLVLAEKSAIPSTMRHLAH
ncbi:hypothetical protein AVEN_159004-1 [Araneus ventricosus]|uniref:RNase H type-1 domain-containing protein n=1 Tax=Araneus ventricosus TaxID=182803 RepID=A0A4Y2BA55_ARAVE|nr:hypothetical protein AVEN_159004-1 [Araneus ventricosus]